MSAKTEITIKVENDSTIHGGGGFVHITTQISLIQIEMLMQDLAYAKARLLKDMEESRRWFVETEHTYKVFDNYNDYCKELSFHQEQGNQVIDDGEL